MLGARTNCVPRARLLAKTIQPMLLRVDLRAGRRWHWCGKRGWWLHCCLLQEQGSTWHLRRFVATVPEACTFLNIQEEDWTWQEVAPEPACGNPSQQQAYVPFLMF